MYPEHGYPPIKKKKSQNVEQELDEIFLNCHIPHLKLFPQLVMPFQQNVHRNIRRKEYYPSNCQY